METVRFAGRYGEDNREQARALEEALRAATGSEELTCAYGLVWPAEEGVPTHVKLRITLAPAENGKHAVELGTTLLPDTDEEVQPMIDAVREALRALTPATPSPEQAAGT